MTLNAAGVKNENIPNIIAPKETAMMMAAIQLAFNGLAVVGALSCQTLSKYRVIPTMEKRAAARRYNLNIRLAPSSRGFGTWDS